MGGVTLTVWRRRSRSRADVVLSGSFKYWQLGMTNTNGAGKTKVLSCHEGASNISDAGVNRGSGDYLGKEWCYAKRVHTQCDRNTPGILQT